MTMTKYAIVTGVILSILLIFAANEAYGQLGPDDTHIGTPSPVEKDTIGTPPGPYPFPKPKDILPPQFPWPPSDIEKSKQGGKDPIVIGDWWYQERDCFVQRATFDFNNNGINDSLCYNIVGDVLIVDFGLDTNNNGISDVDEGIIRGYNMLQFSNTSYEAYSPIGFLKSFPDTCSGMLNCYLWKGGTGDGIAQRGELVPFTMSIDSVTVYNEGVKNYQYPESGIDRYVYCEGTTENNESFYCLEPTFYGYE